MELNKYIKEILIIRDNVIISDFGAFEKVTVSASIDEKTGEMTPPHTDVVFRANLKSDNGVLIKHVAEKEKLDEAKVKEELAKQVATWNSNLEAGKNVIIPGIGLLHKDNSTGEVTFQSNVKPSDFPDSYGLPVITVQEKSASVQKTPVGKTDKKKPIKKKPVKKQPPTKKKPPVKKTVKQKPVKENTGDKKGNKKLIIGLSVGIPIAALIVLGILYFDFVKSTFNDASNFVSELFSGEEQKDTSSVEVVNIDSLNTKDSSVAETEAIIENYNIVNSETNTKVEPKLEELGTVKKVHIIAGSFQQKSLAQRHRNKLNRKGFKATILPLKKGLYRVTVGSFDKMEEAAKNLEQIKSIDESMSFWILVDK